MAEQKPNVSKHLIDRAALLFLRHPGEAYTRRDIQSALDISKSTAARLLTELVWVLKLDETVEGQTVYYSLSNEQMEYHYRMLDFILAVNDRERLVMNFLLHGYEGDSVFSGALASLEDKFEKAGIITFKSDSIRSVRKNRQHVDGSNYYILDTLINAIETKTKIRIDYKGAFSDGVKTHDLWPVGMYMRDENLYLYAYSPRFEDATSYAYSRMTGIDCLNDQHYELPNNVSMDNVINDPFGIAIDPPERVTVRVLNKQAFFEREKDWPEGTKITDLEDGSIRMEFTISDPFAFRTWALSLGCNCVVEKPCAYSEWIKDELSETLKLY